MTLSTRRPSKPLTQGQFLTLKSNYGARMGSSVLGSSWKTEWVTGKTGLHWEGLWQAWPHAWGHRQSLEHTHVSTSLSARPEEACPLVVESVLCDFFVLFFLIYANHQEPRTSLLSEDEAGAGGTHRRCLCCWLVWECSRYYVTENRDP